MKTAVKPDFFANFQSLRIKDRAKKAKATEEELAFYEMSQTVGWKLFEREIDHLLKDMELLNDNAISKGLSFEEIGRNTLVISMAKGIINRLINIIKDSKETCESGGK